MNKTSNLSDTCLSTQLAGHDSPNQEQNELYNFEEAVQIKEQSRNGWWSFDLNLWEQKKKVYKSK